MKRTKSIALSFFLLFASAACSGSGEPEPGEQCSPGELSCECLENNVCSAGLSCQNATCVLEASETGGATGSGGSSTGGSSNSGGVSATGGTATGGASTGGSASGGDAMTGGAASVGFTLSSSELSDGATFMDKHTCQAGGFDNDESPPLSWSGAPEGTMSYAITFIDRTLLDAGNHLGCHWAIWDLAASVNELPANLPAGMTLTTPVSAKQSRTSYLGPCPNFGGASAAETHTYEFTIYALPTATAGVNGMITAAMIDNLEATALERVTLTGQSSAFTQ